MKVDLSPAESQLIELVRTAKRQSGGGKAAVLVEIENGLIRYMTPSPRIRALKDIDFSGSITYNES